MTDRHAGYIVTLKDNIREDDAEVIVSALSLIKGVISVEPVVADYTTAMGEQRAKYDLTRKILNVLKENGS